MVLARARNALLFLFFAARTFAALAAPIDPQTAEAIATEYTAARWDPRTVEYEQGYMKLWYLLNLDELLRKTSPSPDFTSAHPIWKAARSELLARVEKGLAAEFDPGRLKNAYRKTFTEGFSAEEGAALLEFMRSPLGRSWLSGFRVGSRKVAVEGYLYLVDSWSPPVEPIPAAKARDDLKLSPEEERVLQRAEVLAAEFDQRSAQADLLRKLVYRLASSAQVNNITELTDSGVLPNHVVYEVAERAVEAYRKSAAAKP